MGWLGLCVERVSLLAAALFPIFHHSHLARLLGNKRVDDAALPHVGVSDDPDRNLLLIAEELSELAQERNEGTLPKGVRHRSVERDSRALLRQLSDPPLGDPGGDEIDFVEDVDEVLMLGVVREVLADHLALGSGNVTSVDDVKDDVGTVEDLV